MIARRARVGMIAGFVLLGLAGLAWAGSCVDKGCHADVLDFKYLHGPLAAESVGGQGCVSCHVPAGAPCSEKKGGVFKFVDAKDALCGHCHDRSESPVHLSAKEACLNCHTSHGSDTSATFVKKK